MATLYTTVDSGQGVSGVLAIDGDYPIAILVPSLSPACAVQVQFTVSSGQGYGYGGYGQGGYGGPSADYLTPTRLDDGGAPYTVHSGAGPAWAVLEMPMTPWVRVSLVSSQSDTRTFTLLRLAVWTE